MRPGRAECRGVWGVVQEIYADLEGGTPPDAMPPQERRALDALLVGPDGRPRVVEIDESQHFTPFRATTLRRYPGSVDLAFDPEAWIARCRATSRLAGGGFARPRPPLFPGPGGRHRQRAFRDALADLVPPEHGFAPTLRIHDREVTPWLRDPDAPDRMADLIRPRLAGTNAEHREDGC